MININNSVVFYMDDIVIIKKHKYGFIFYDNYKYEDDFTGIGFIQFRKNNKLRIFKPFKMISKNESQIFKFH